MTDRLEISERAVTVAARAGAITLSFAECLSVAAPIIVAAELRRLVQEFKDMGTTDADVVSHLHKRSEELDPRGDSRG